MQRRQFLLASAVAAAPSSSWQPGKVRHLIPTASHDRILLKASFEAPLANAPVLRAGTRTFPGRMTDTRGEFWSFDATALAPGQPHNLQLFDAKKKPLCDPWELRTFPVPGARPERFRVLIHTCAGGDERIQPGHGPAYFLPLPTRHRLLDRALSFQPDAHIANGDHIYWDLRQTGAPPRYREDLIAATGRFERTAPVMGTANEDVLKRVCRQQILKLYETRFRGVPSFFLQDDHDYFENDDANATMVTYPPDHFMVQLGRGTRNLCYPEFLPDANRPLGLPGASAVDKPAGCGESYGTLRFGSLAEICLFDCRRYLSLAGPNAWVVPPETEQWLKARLQDRGMAHVAYLSSMPPVWSAGKWGDWYPDFLDAAGKLSLKAEKPFYQSGWTSQHDRLMQALSAQPSHIPLWISGDMHAHGEAQLLRTGSTDLRANPVNCFLSGALGTGDGWPSKGRRTRPYPSLHVEVDEKLPALEENGFLLVDFDPAATTVRSFRWTPEQGLDAIDRLQPYRTTVLKRRG
ncbi:MAG: hypothetical protein JNK87_20820 [Bryobacterales bacterium]|nr:hypothetical protein [Bryobacterales bacterium]